MQIFAYTECSNFQSLLEVECRQITGVKPVIQNSLEDLIGLLGIFPKIDVLIVDIPDEFYKIQALKEILERNNSRIKNALILGNETGSSGNMKLFTREDIPKMLEELRSASTFLDNEKKEWKSIPISTLVHFQCVPFDLYIKLSDQNLVKRIHAYEEIDRKLLKTLMRKGISALYCEKKYNRDFSRMLINNMINRVDRSYETVVEELKAQEEVFCTTKQIIQKLGLNGRVVEVCEATIEKMCLEVLNRPSEFSAFLYELQNNHDLAFHYKLVNVTNYLGTQLIMEMNLKNNDEEVKKFIFASYFCDMILKKPDYLLFRKTTDAENLTLDEQNEVNFHALKASELVFHYRDIPKEVAVIIRQHHGSFVGIGFPAEKSEDLHLLAKILIVSQELAFSILTNVDTPVMEILRGFLKTHKSAGLKDLLMVLEESFTEKLGETG